MRTDMPDGTAQIWTRAAATRELAHERRSVKTRYWARRALALMDCYAVDRVEISEPGLARTARHLRATKPYGKLAADRGWVVYVPATSGRWARSSRTIVDPKLNGGKK